MKAGKVWESFTNQQQWREYLQHLVKTNDKALIRAIHVIYARQTEEEQYYGTTTDHNGRGFGKIDAAFFTEIVDRLRHGGKLSPKQMAIARNKMPKYWRQLMEESKAKMAAQNKSPN